MATSVAVLVDGDYFVRLFRRKVNPTKSMSGTELAKLMWRYWILHADPLTTNRSIGYSSTTALLWKIALFIQSPIRTSTFPRLHKPFSEKSSIKPW